MLIEAIAAPRPTPVSVKISGDNGKRYTQWMGHALEAGQFPDFFIESGRLIGEGETAPADSIIGYTPFPDEITAALENVHFHSRLDRLLERNGGSAVTAAKKIELLGRHINEAMALNDAYLAQLRIYETESHFDALKTDEEARKAAGRWFAHFLQHSPGWWSNASSDVHRWIMRKFLELMREQPEFEDEMERRWFHAEDHIPVIYKRLRQDSENFINAETREEALIAAKRLQQARIGLKKYRLGLYELGMLERHMSAPSRYDIKNALEKGEPARLAWTHHLRWALGEGEHTEADKTGSQLIQETARSLGAEDPRFPGTENQKCWREYTLDELTISNDGSIIALKPTPDEAKEALREQLRKRFEAETLAEIIEREYALQLERDAREAALVDTVDWQEMANDFWGFVEKHQEHILPPSTVVPGEFPFAHAFLHRFRLLIVEDANKWKPVFITFLTGYAPEERAKKGHYYDEDRPIEVRPFSLPSLAYRFKHDYFRAHDGRLELLRGRLPEGHPMAERLNALSDMRRAGMQWEYDRDEETYKWVDYKPEPIAKEQEHVFIQCLVDPRHPYAKALLSLRSTDKRILPILRRRH